MAIRIAALAFALALVPGVVAAAQSPPPPAPILQLANAVIHAANTDDASALSALYTDDAVVVDENAPFRWRGTGAGVAWWHSVEAVTRKAKLMHLRSVNVRLGEFKQSSTDAYLVQAMTVTGIMAGKPFAEAGTMTYTFHATGGKWLISSMVWTTKP